jgi:peptide/nickel transport system substrate-binding protein
MTAAHRKSNSGAIEGQEFDRRMAAYLGGVMGRRVDRRTLLGGAAAATVAVAAARQAPTARAALNMQGTSTFTFGLDGDVHGLEPAFAYDSATLPVVSQISEGLLAFDVEGALQPLLAERWEQPDPLTYVYHLREGVTFHDGTTMTSADVLASIARVRDPEIASPVAWMYDAVDTVAAPDDLTVTITLNEPSALFRYVPAVSAGYVVSQAAIEQNGMELTRNPVGTGPYRFVRWDAGSQVVLEKHADYWQAGKPYFDQVVFKVVPEGTTRTAGLKTGELDAVAIIPADQIASVTGLANVTMQEVVSFGVYTIAMRTDQPPFDDAKVRAAVSHALDVGTAVATMVGDGGVVASATTVPPNMPGSAAAELTPIPFDLARARELLAESEHPEGFATTLLTGPLEEWVAISVYAQEALRELGIELTVEKQTWEEVVGVYQSGEYEGMIFFGWLSDFPDASGMLLPIFHSRNVPPQPNIAYYHNPEVDALLDASESELDAEARQGMLVEAQELIAADMPVVWIEYPKQFWAMNAAITGYELSPLWAWECFTRDLLPA